ncbi:MAG: CPBP family intramembrane metalloprotease [Firmicutes bacterium]|nr:CPBP family intramembrane metalloprotease [Bacillota bacterium]
MQKFGQKFNKIEPLYQAIIFLLVACLAITLPVGWLAELTNGLITPMIVRFVFAGIGIVFIIMLGQKRDFLVGKNCLKYWDLILVSLLICLANFPIFTLLQGYAYIDGTATRWITFIFAMIAVSAFEEIFFRCLIYVALYKFFLSKNYSEIKSVIWAFIVSSIIFALVHLFNLFQHPPSAVFLQVGYTFLLGMLFVALYYFTKSILPAITVHALFNIGGLMLIRDVNLGGGYPWNVSGIFFSSILFSLAGIYIAVRVILEFRKRIRDTQQKLAMHISTD